MVTQGEREIESHCLRVGRDVEAAPGRESRLPPGSGPPADGIESLTAGDPPTARSGQLDAPVGLDQVATALDPDPSGRATPGRAEEDRDLVEGEVANPGSGVADDVADGHDCCSLLSSFLSGFGVNCELRVGSLSTGGTTRIPPGDA